MLDLFPGRRTNPAAISAGEVVDACNTLGELIVQFSRPDACTPALLGALNEACGTLGDRLTVRFFGETFDAAVLRHLPNVASLSVDCLRRISNEKTIAWLSHLEKLTFGVFESDRPDLLNVIRVDRLKYFSLTETRKRNVDLAPLGRCRALEKLSIEGHSKHIEAIAELPLVRTLRLRAYGKGNPLDFVAAMPALRTLTLILGGRIDLDDMKSATLEALQIIRVRGLATLGDLSRFPALKTLWIEDQMQLKTIDIGGTQLEQLRLATCKQLAELLGLDVQRRLRSFSAAQVALDMNALRDREWPATMRSISLFSGSSGKWRAEAQARLQARGYDEEPMQFDLT